MEAIYYAFDTHESHFLDILTKQHMKIGVLAPQVYTVEKNRMIHDSLDRRFLEICNEYNVKLMPLVINKDFNSGIIQDILINSQYQQEIISTLLEHSLKRNYIGIQFDFEHIPYTYQQAYSDFCAKCAEVFHKHKLIFSIAVIPRWCEQSSETSYGKWLFDEWSGVYDYYNLSKYADFLSVMAYDQHRKSTPPGPVSGLPWVQKIIEYLLSQVPGQKISLGIPGYSCHWAAAAKLGQDFYCAHQLSHLQAMKILDENDTKIEWDSAAEVDMARFQRDYINEYIYLENLNSFRKKTELIKKHELRGFSFWALGLEDPLIWSETT